MTLAPPSSHLATEAIVALVDRELSATAQARATAHVARCPQCASDVGTQREAKQRLAAAATPGLPGGLLSRLQALPFTTELPGLDPSGPDGADRGLAWPSAGRPGGASLPLAVPASPFPHGSPLPSRPPGPGRADRTADAGGPDAGPAPRRPHPPRRRLRTGLLGVTAGLAVGVLAATGAPADARLTGGAVPPRVVPVVPATRVGVLNPLVGSLDGAVFGARGRGVTRAVRSAPAPAGVLRPLVDVASPLSPRADDGAR